MTNLEVRRASILLLSAPRSGQSPADRYDYIKLRKYLLRAAIGYTNHAPKSMSHYWAGGSDTESSDVAVGPEPQLERQVFHQCREYHFCACNGVLDVLLYVQLLYQYK